MPSSMRSTPGAIEPAGATTDAQTRVLRRFRLVFNAVKTHFQQVEKRAGVGGAQVWALSLIADHPGMGVTGLAQAMDIHQSTASNLVKSLASQGLVVAERNGPDRRAVQLRILAAGKRVLRLAPAPFTGVLPDALSKLDTATLTRLDRDLGVLIDGLRTDDRAARTPLAQMQMSSTPLSADRRPTSARDAR